MWPLFRKRSSGDYTPLRYLILQVQILYDYAILRGHIKAYHPTCLDAFIKGWGALDRNLQKKWLESGKRPRRPGSFSDIENPPTWTSWVDYQHQHYSLVFRNARDSEGQITDVIEALMDDAGSLYGIPELPLEDMADLPEYVRRSIEGRRKSRKWSVSRSAAQALIQEEITRALQGLMERLQANGLEEVRRHWPPKIDFANASR